MLKVIWNLITFVQCEHNIAHGIILILIIIRSVDQSESISQPNETAQDSQTPLSTFYHTLFYNEI